MKPRWVPIDEKLRARIDHNSGAYAIRKRGSKSVAYVGESHRGRMWKTLLRHFQAPESFRKVRETGVFATSPDGYEAAVWVTSKGAKPRGGPADQKAMKAQAEWIALLDPTKNKDDGLTYELPGEDEDPWGGLISNPDKELPTVAAADRTLKYADDLQRVAIQDGSDLAWENAFTAYLIAADAYNEAGSTKESAVRALVEKLKKKREKDKKPVKATDTNVFAIQELFENVDRIPNRVSSTDAPHVKRAFKAGLIKQDGQTFVLTPEGKEAIAARKRLFSQVRNPGVSGRPAGGLVELGKLTSLVWKAQGKKGMRTYDLAVAPSLVYDDRGRLFVVYGQAPTDVKAPVRGLASYVRKHWGTLPTSTSLSTGELAEAPFVTLGVATEITYTTRKDDKKPVDYHHIFGETLQGMQKHFTPPSVLEHACATKRCACLGRLALSGGTYRVTDHGIVG